MTEPKPSGKHVNESNAPGRRLVSRHGIWLFLAFALLMVQFSVHDAMDGHAWRSLIDGVMLALLVMIAFVWWGTED